MLTRRTFFASLAALTVSPRVAPEPAATVVYVLFVLVAVLYIVQRFGIS